MLDADVLTEAEAAMVETARQAYNTAIAGIAAGDDDLLLFDAAALLDELNGGGINYGTGVITSTFATGGGFSLDGIHPTSRGNAVIANAIIDFGKRRVRTIGVSEEAEPLYWYFLNSAAILAGCGLVFLCDRTELWMQLIGAGLVLSALGQLLW